MTESTPARDLASVGRATCYRCLRPASLCVCESVTRVDNRTEVLVLQHPREHRHPFGTARFARLGLSRSRVLVPQRGFDRSLSVVPELGPRAALLYPSRGARPLSSLSAEERPAQLVVLDGTWTSVRRLLRDNPWLAELPHLSLSPTAPSRYRIRREPRPECLSTIESIVAALGVLEPETRGLPGLLDAFDRMIDQQLALTVRGQGPPRRKRRRQRPSRAVPEALLRERGRQVIVYGETQELASRRDPRAPELLQWVALRPATGETLSCFVEPGARPPSTSHLGRVGVSRAALREALAPDAFAEGWRRFVRDDDRLLAWNPGTLDLIAPFAPTLEGLLLKGVYCNLRRRPAGTLDEVVAREGLTPPRLGIEGRAGRRLENAAAVLALLQAAQPQSSASRR